MSYHIKQICILSLLPLFAFLSPKEKTAIVFIGDSITEAGALPHPAQEAPPVCAYDYIRSKAKYDLAGFSNQGHSGATTLDFLPGTRYYEAIRQVADSFSRNSDVRLLFSIMLGTNDSAIEGTHGAPVSNTDYAANLKQLIDSLHDRFPKSRFVLHAPLWYSSNTYNGAKYLQEGLDRIKVYTGILDQVVRDYQKQLPGIVFKGDRRGYDYFRTHFQSAMRAENGQKGTFYLHPNQAGARSLGNFWGKAIVKILP